MVDVRDLLRKLQDSDRHALARQLPAPAPAPAPRPAPNIHEVLSQPRITIAPRPEPIVAAPEPPTLLNTTPQRFNQLRDTLLPPATRPVLELVPSITTRPAPIISAPPTPFSLTGPRLALKSNTFDTGGAGGGSATEPVTPTTYSVYVKNDGSMEEVIVPDGQEGQFGVTVGRGSDQYSPGRSGMTQQEAQDYGAPLFGTVSDETPGTPGTPWAFDPTGYAPVNRPPSSTVEGDTRLTDIFKSLTMEDRAKLAADARRRSRSADEPLDPKDVGSGAGLGATIANPKPDFSPSGLNQTPDGPVQGPVQEPPVVIGAGGQLYPRNWTPVPLTSTDDLADLPAAPNGYYWVLPQDDYVPYLVPNGEAQPGGTQLINEDLTDIDPTDVDAPTDAINWDDVGSKIKNVLIGDQPWPDGVADWWDTSVELANKVPIIREFQTIINSTPELLDTASSIWDGAKHVPGVESGAGVIGDLVGEVYDHIPTSVRDGAGLILRSVSAPGDLVNELTIGNIVNIASRGSIKLPIIYRDDRGYHLLEVPAASGSVFGHEYDMRPLARFLDDTVEARTGKSLTQRYQEDGYWGALQGAREALFGDSAIGYALMVGWLIASDPLTIIGGGGAALRGVEGAGRAARLLRGLGRGAEIIEDVSDLGLGHAPGLIGKGVRNTPGLGRDIRVGDRRLPGLLTPSRASEREIRANAARAAGEEIRQADQTPPPEPGSPPGGTGPTRPTLEGADTTTPGSTEAPGATSDTGTTTGEASGSTGTAGPGAGTGPAARTATPPEATTTPPEATGAGGNESTGTASQETPTGPYRTAQDVLGDPDIPNRWKPKNVADGETPDAITKLYDDVPDTYVRVANDMAPQWRVAEEAAADMGHGEPRIGHAINTSTITRETDAAITRIDPDAASRNWIESGGNTPSDTPASAPFRDANKVIREPWSSSSSTGARRRLYGKKLISREPSTVPAAGVRLNAESDARLVALNRYVDLVQEHAAWHPEDLSIKKFRDDYRRAADLDNLLRERGYRRSNGGYVGPDGLPALANQHADITGLAPYTGPNAVIDRFGNEIPGRGPSTGTAEPSAPQAPAQPPVREVSLDADTTVTVREMQVADLPERIRERFDAADTAFEASLYDKGAFRGRYYGKTEDAAIDTARRAAEDQGLLNAEPVRADADGPTVRAESNTDGRGVPRTVQRFEEPGKSVGNPSKPQGLYTSPSDIESPHAELGGDRIVQDTNPNANVLEVTDQRRITNNRGTVDESAGVSALRHLVGEQRANELNAMSKREVLAIAEAEYPSVDFSRAYDAQDVLEQYAGMKARGAGYDAIWAPDRADPTFDEYVGLTDNAFLGGSRNEALPGRPKGSDTEPETPEEAPATPEETPTAEPAPVETPTGTTAPETTSPTAPTTSPGTAAKAEPTPRRDRSVQDGVIDEPSAAALDAHARSRGWDTGKVETIHAELQRIQLKSGQRVFDTGDLATGQGRAYLAKVEELARTKQAIDLQNAHLRQAERDAADAGKRNASRNADRQKRIEKIDKINKRIETIRAKPQTDATRQQIRKLNLEKRGLGQQAGLTLSAARRRRFQQRLEDLRAKQGQLERDLRISVDKPRGTMRGTVFAELSPPRSAAASYAKAVNKIKTLTTDPRPVAGMPVRRGVQLHDGVVYIANAPLSDTAVRGLTQETFGNGETALDRISRYIDESDGSRSIEDVVNESVDQVIAEHKQLLGELYPDIKYPPGLRQFMTMTNLVRDAILFSWMGAPRYIGTQYLGNLQIQSLSGVENGWRYFTGSVSRSNRKAIDDLVRSSVEVTGADPVRSFADLTATEKLAMVNGHRISSAVTDGLSGDLPGRRLELGKFYESRGWTQGKASKAFFGDPGVAHNAMVADVVGRDRIYDIAYKRQLAKDTRAFVDDHLVPRLLDEGYTQAQVDGIIEGFFRSQEHPGWGFSSNEVRSYFRDYLPQNMSDRLGRDWQEIGHERNRIANKEVTRITFAGQGSTKLDELLRPFVMFHFFSSRQLGFISTQALKHPALINFYVNSQRALQDYAETHDLPEWLKGSVAVSSALGITGFLRPFALLQVGSIYGDPTIDFDDGTPKTGMQKFFGTKVPVVGGTLQDWLFVNPVIMNTLNTLGYMGDDRDVDWFQSNQEGQLAAFLINLGKAKGVFPDEFLGDGPVGNVSPNLPINNQLRDKLSQLGLPGNETVDFVDSSNRERRDWYALLEDEARKEELDPNDIDDAAIIEAASTDPNSALYQAAWSRYWKGEAVNVLSRLTPGVASLRPSVRWRNVTGDDLILSQTDLESWLRNVTDPNARDLIVQSQQYYDLGDEKESVISEVYNQVLFGTVLDSFTVNGKTYTPEQIRGMTTDQREAVADALLLEYGLLDNYDAYQQEQDDFLTTGDNKEFATFKTWAKGVRGYDGGVEGYWEELAQGNPNAAVYLQRINDEHLSPSARERKLTNLESFMWMKGYQYRYDDPTPIDTSENGSGVFDPLNIGNQSPQAQEPYVSDYEQNLRKGVPSYFDKIETWDDATEEKASDLGYPDVPFNDLSTKQRKNVEDQLEDEGIYEPKIPWEVLDYIEWAEQQAPGADTSIDAFLAASDQAYREKAPERLEQELKPKPAPDDMWDTILNLLNEHDYTRYP